LQTFASDYDDSKAHITEEERNKVREAKASTESWMFDMQGQQGDVARNANPVLTVDAINKKRNELFSVTNPIMTKPKPKPAPAPAPAASPSPAPAKEDAKDEGKQAEPSQPEGHADAKGNDSSEGDVSMDM
jgi:hypothetical protein